MDEDLKYPPCYEQDGDNEDACTYLVEVIDGKFETIERCKNCKFYKD